MLAAGLGRLVRPSAARKTAPARPAQEAEIAQAGIPRSVPPTLSILVTCLCFSYLAFHHADRPVASNHKTSDWAALTCQKKEDHTLCTLFESRVNPVRIFWRG
jgi:hypothetical protein